MSIATPANSISLSDDLAPAPALRTRWSDILGLACIAFLFIAVGSKANFVDPDLFHEMALARAAVQRGALPKADLFAYTPTVFPSVHHEWGTGMLLYAVVRAWGGTGLMTVKFLLIATVLGVSVFCARRRGATLSVICVLAPISMLFGYMGVTTIRAQFFTLAFTAILLLMLEQDRRGSRRWILPWLALYVLWLNLHGGFVVGIALLGAHWLEQVLRHRNAQWHLVATAAAMAVLLLVNPYGKDFPIFVWRSITLPRPLITEWRPIWQSPDFSMVLGFVISLVCLIYAAARIGWRRMDGILILLLCAYAAVRHGRHASVYSVAWLCYAPVFVQRTPLGQFLGDFWERRRRLIGVVLASITLVCAIAAIPRKPWRLNLPTNPAPNSAIVYPAGAVDYLRQQQMAANVMTPFEVGAFVSWKVGPAVKVSVDGRYEVAYQPGVVEEMMAFYAVEPGWQVLLQKYPTDLVLAATSSKLATAMAKETGWPCIYRDDAYELFARPGMILPVVDRRGTKLSEQFP